MIRDSNSVDITATIYFKDNKKIENADLPTEFIHPSGQFVMYWVNQTDLISVPSDTIELIVLKVAAKEE